MAKIPKGELGRRHRASKARKDQRGLDASPSKEAWVLHRALLSSTHARIPGEPEFLIRKTCWSTGISEEVGDRAIALFREARAEFPGPTNGDIWRAFKRAEEKAKAQAAS